MGVGPGPATASAAARETLRGLETPRPFTPFLFRASVKITQRLFAQRVGRPCRPARRGTQSHRHRPPPAQSLCRPPSAQRSPGPRRRTRMKLGCCCFLILLFVPAKPAGTELPSCLSLRLPFPSRVLRTHAQPRRGFGPFWCYCPPGFRGALCQLPDEASACRNGATAFGTECVCPPGYRGLTCQDQEQPSPCLNGGTPLGTGCRCPPAFWGLRCECQHPESPVATAVGGRCICPPGLSGPRCDAPDTSTACQHGATAVGTECYCPSGYSGARCELRNASTAATPAARPGATGPKSSTQDPVSAGNGTAASGTTAERAVKIGSSLWRQHLSPLVLSPPQRGCTRDPAGTGLSPFVAPSRREVLCPGGVLGEGCEIPPKCSSWAHALLLREPAAGFARSPLP
uniref:EGF-like domain-containing protein n=1 Tax=Dromaius novaehollandiae TaxID=8790 RepID=A0A8C4JFR0_DRONO